MTDEEILTKYGWELECESPFEIRNMESGSFATGEAANYVVAALREEDTEDNERSTVFQQTKIFAEWLEFVRYHTNYTKNLPDWPSFADVLHSGLLQRMLMGQKPLNEIKYKKLKGSYSGLHKA